MQKTDQKAVLVMGILNVTPDSFYEGSRVTDEASVGARVEQILREGGDIIDVGACSTRPGADIVDEEEEMRRLDFALGVVRRTAPEAVVSVDTFREGVACRCVGDWGVNVINDISGGNEEMYRAVARRKVGYVLTHNDPDGRSNTPGKAALWLSDRLERLRALGAEDVWLDPGFGFHKTLQENWALLRGLGEIAALGAPVLAGVSRKSMIWRLLDISPAEALNATTATHVLALQQGASVLRVHDVKAAVETVKIVNNFRNQ